MATDHHSSLIMLVLLVLFAVVHSGGAALRVRAEAVIGARAWRLIFAAVSIPSAVVVIGWFLAHRYDGLRLWNLQGVPGMVPMMWIGTAISFLFLYPATYNLLEIPAQSPDFGEAHESMAIGYSGPDLQVAFNPAFVMDPLRALTKDEVFFELKDEVSPGVFKTLENFICVIMPVRL